MPPRSPLPPSANPLRQIFKPLVAVFLTAALVLLAGSASARSFGRTCTIRGTAKADTLRGTPRGDVICGLAGDDRIVGGSGDDVVVAGSGADRLSGGRGKDVLLGGPGADLLLASDGQRDLVDGGAGRDEAVVDPTDRVRGVEVRTRKSGSEVVVAAAGDIACDPGSGAFNGGAGTASSCHQRATADLIAQMNPDAVLGLGDFQYEDGALDKYMRSYDRSWGAFKSKTWTTPGSSHDQYGGGDYYAYFGSRAGRAPFSSYSVELGSWHIVSVNANCSQVGGCGPGSKWEAWLRRDLVAHPARCTLAFWHFPRWSSGPRHGSDRRSDAFVRDLYAAGAELILSGHDHDYERFAPQNADGVRDDTRGLVQFVVGTGGKSLDQPRRAAANSVVRNGDTFGVLRLVLRPASYEWRFVPEKGKTFTDSGSAACH